MAGMRRTLQAHERIPSLVVLAAFAGWFLGTEHRSGLSHPAAVLAAVVIAVALIAVGCGFARLCRARRDGALVLGLCLMAALALRPLF
jgi:amino acid transporter